MRGSAKTPDRGPLRYTAPPLTSVPRLVTHARPLITPPAFSRDQRPTTQRAQATPTARKTILCGCRLRRATRLTKAAQMKTTSLGPAVLLCTVRPRLCPLWTCPPSTRLAKWKNQEMQGHMPLQENFLRTAVLSQRLWPIMRRRENQRQHLLKCMTGGHCLQEMMTGRATTVAPCLWV